MPGLAFNTRTSSFCITLPIGIAASTNLMPVTAPSGALTGSPCRPRRQSVQAQELKSVLVDDAFLARRSERKPGEPLIIAFDGAERIGARVDEAVREKRVRRLEAVRHS